MSSSSGSWALRVNFVGIVAAALALVSVLLPWWGITVDAFGTRNHQWGIWFPSTDTVPGIATADLSNVLTTYSPIILLLSIAATALAIAGSFTSRYLPIVMSLVLALASVLGYAWVVSYAVSQNCQSSGCITQPTGSYDIPFIGGSVTWGFQMGFYIFTAATVILLVGLVVHRPLTHQRESATKTI
jgi:hypothetical protein